MELAKILLLAVVPLLMGLTSGAPQFEATNNASNTPGGARFDAEIGLDYSKTVMSDASSFIWAILNQQNEVDRKQVDLIKLTISSFSGVAYTFSDGIYVSSDYIDGYSGDMRTEITGVLYHEVAHVWQWNGQGQAPGGLIEGIADYVRLKANYIPSHWVKPGEGQRWDQGYDVTARFLDYCNTILDNNFVARLNAKMRDGYSGDFFTELLGKNVDQLWTDYKAYYGRS